MANEKKSEEVVTEQGSVSLGKYLAQARVKTGLSLRAVEDATGKEISNAYLSQLEKDKIAKPSPKMLHALSGVYGMPYETLMRYAGYLPVSESPGTARQPENTFTIENVSPQEEEALLKYLEFLRFNRKHP